MKKVIFGIFAHPDDEAFGPAGTLLLETSGGSELHLITLTAGEKGMNPDNVSNLSEVRLEEWRKAGHLLGASSMHHLGYKDGHLDNQVMTEAAERIVKIVTEVIHTVPTNACIEFISFDFSGLSGHIDHIVATRATCLAFYRLQESDSRLSRIRLFCLSEEFHPKHDTSWLFMEQGRKHTEIDEVVDARNFRDEIIAVMSTHNSQRIDSDKILKLQGDSLGLNHFIVKN